MFLKELEIIGFKSFSEKTNIKFTNAINAIVGPNGSGKSNIADAIRWVIGEQSVKILRGNKMEDVIFAGSDKKKASGFAEVTLVLDNSDRAIDMDFNEISITRRMYRSGESEYYINKTQCRLKDIIEMLMDTGMGKEGYSIIGQGRIDEILNNKSDGRRIIFEEAAGITKYKHRKAESEKKLEQTEKNIERLEDIIYEISNQLAPLKQQADVARKYIKMMEELKVLEVNLIINSIEKNKEKLNDTIAKLEELKKLLLERESDIEKNNQYKSEQKLLIKELENTIQAINNEIYNYINQKEKLEGEGKLLEEKKSFLKLTLDKLSKEEESLRLQRDKILFNLEEENKALTLYKGQAGELLDEIIYKENEYKNKFSSIDELEQKTEELKASHIELLNESSEKKNRINSLVSLKSNLEKRLSQLNIDNELLAGQYENKISLLNENKEEIEDIEDSISKIIEREKELKNEKEKVEESLKELEERLIDTRSKRDNIISRLKLLEEMERDFGGYNKAVKTILMNHQDIKKKVSGFRGAVGEIISVNSDYAVAIEVALGSTIQNIITDDEEDAKLLIEYLKKNKLGRATFLPIRSIKPKNLEQHEMKHLKMPGVLGIAAEMVSYDSEFRNIVYYLLGRVVIVDNLKNAIELAKASNYSYRIVTLEGELISSGGAITGGSLTSNASNIITRKSQIKELKKEYSLLLRELDNLSKNIELQKDKIVLYENDINHCIETLHNFEIEINNKKNKNIIINNDLEVIKSKISINEKEIEELNLEKKRIDDNIFSTEKELEDIKDKIDSIEENILKMQDSLKAQKEQSKEFSDQITALKIKEAQLKQQILSIEQNIERNKINLDGIEAKIKEIGDEVKETETQLILMDERIAENKKIIEDIIAKHDEKKQQLNDLEQVKNKELKHLEKIEEETDLLQQEINNIQNNIHKTDMVKVKIEMEIENMEFKLLDNYELSYRKALELKIKDFNISKSAKRCEELKEEIRSLGTINVNAVEEFEKLNNRYEFLKKQLDDMVNAKESLIKVIDEITRYMKKQFIEEFNKINKNFNEVFVKLFGGGEARVVLSDDNDVLNSDIEIIAKPPGKKLQNLMLLSGGERALTAIALLFAILKMKPAPFCILDEIDSALDDANVGRYAEFLKEFSTQFIIITHRKGSMEVADCLYGVTMDDSGTSKLLSVMLEDKVS